MTNLIATGWQYIFGIVGIVVAVLAAWISGKSKGTTEAIAKADIESANQTAKQSQAASDKQASIIKVAKDADQTNQSLSDDAARDRMRKSKYHSDY
jgi:gas vesicle protein